MNPEEPAAPPPSTAAKRPRGLWRKVLWGLLGLALVMAGIVAFLPAILSSGFGKERILGVARSRIRAPVDAGVLSFSWGGSQRIEGLRIGAPPGFPETEDTLRVESIVVRGGLLGLIFSGDEIAVEVEKPVLNVRRAKDGSLNIEALRPADAAGPAGKKEPAGKKGPREGGPGPPEEGKPAFPRKVDVHVTSGKITYRDDALGAGSDITDIDAALSAGREDITLHSSARISPPEGGAPGTLSLKASIQGVETPFSLERLRVEADGGAESVDLRPYAGLLEKMGGLTPPAEAVTWTFKGSTKEGAIDARTSARAGNALTLDATASLSPGSPERKWKLAASGDASLELLAASAVKVKDAGGERPPLEIEKTGRLRLTGLDLSGVVPSEAPFGQKALRSLQGGGRFEVTGRVASGGWVLERGSAALRAGEGKVSLESIEGVLNGGKATGSATVDLAEEPPRYSATAHLEEVAANYELTPLLAYVIPFLSLDGEKAVFTGKIHGDLDIAGRGLDRASMEKDIGGKGNIRIREGTISASRFFGEAADILGADLGEVGFAEIGSDFVIHPGKVQCEKVFFTGKPGGKVRNLGLKGMSRFDGSIEFGVDVAGLRETVGDKKIQRVLEGLEKVIGNGMLPLKLAGTLEAPQLALELPGGGQSLEAILKGDGKAGAEADSTPELPVDEILDLFKRKKKKPRKPETSEK